MRTGQCQPMSTPEEFFATAVQRAFKEQLIDAGHQSLCTPELGMITLHPWFNVQLLSSSCSLPEGGQKLLFVPVRAQNRSKFK